ncbi:hypothetical protein POM88_025085 [Heracleum sosnowskyi]|uniref:Uncharacterized protein n=1 Tax=Heracleum sosnowskyi TaxID=360622 RepID=A0AAD8I493_9APIA|nr:hypothetical protein POM88_025085 [Heracleum sosnowskyi]
MLVLRDKALGARVKELISRANAKRNDQGGSCLYDIPPHDDDDDDDDDEVGGGEASGNAGNAGGSNSGNTGIQSQNEGNEETPSQEKKDAGATDEEEPRILEALEASILRYAIDFINAEKDAVTKGTVDKETVKEDVVMEDTVDKVEAEENINREEGAFAEGGQDDSSLQNSGESTSKRSSKKRKVDVDQMAELMYNASEMITAEFANLTKIMAAEFASSTKLLIAAETDRLEKK